MIEILNRQAKFNYEILETYEAGIVLTGTEIKSLRNGNANIKDSYANCIVPFLVNHYKTIYVVDTRHYKSSISDFINENSAVTDVLLLYNMNTIDDDLGIGGIY